MPVAQINILEGRSDEQKEALIREVTDALCRSLGAPSRVSESLSMKCRSSISVSVANPRRSWGDELQL